MRFLLLLLLFVAQALAHTVTLTWNAPLPSPGYTFKSYTVYRRAQTDTHWTQLARYLTETTYIDASALNDTTYTYTVRAEWINDTTRRLAQSVLSNKVTVTIPTT